MLLLVNLFRFVLDVWFDSSFSVCFRLVIVRNERSTDWQTRLKSTRFDERFYLSSITFTINTSFRIQTSCLQLKFTWFIQKSTNARQSFEIYSFLIFLAHWQNDSTRVNNLRFRYSLLRSPGDYWKTRSFHSWGERMRKRINAAIDDAIN